MDNNLDDVMGSNPTYTGPTVSSQIPNWVQPGTPNLHSGGFFGALDNVMSAAIPLFVASGAAYLGGSALGLFGGMGSGVAGAAAEAGAGTLGAGLGSAAADVGLGSAAIDAGSLGLGDLIGAGGLSSAGTAAAGAGGLGSMVGVAGGAPAVVSIGAPAAAAGGSSGLGGYLASAGGLGGAALSGTLSGTNMDYGSPSAISDATANASANGSTDWLSTLQQGGSALSSIGKIGSAINDYTTNSNNQDYWQNQMNTLNNMYAPGSPEATLMEQQMNAKDAAAGRNSQYGTRATNLAAALAQQKANILTSPSYYNMGTASRTGATNSLNSLWNVAGQASNAASGISSILGLGKSLFG